MDAWTLSILDTADHCKREAERVIKTFGPVPGAQSCYRCINYKEGGCSRYKCDIPDERALIGCQDCEKEIPF